MRKPFSMEKSHFVRATPSRVMDQLLDPTTWPQWQPEIVSTDGAGAVSTGDEVRGRARLLGFHVDGLSSALEVGTSEFEEDVIVGVRMRVRYEVKEVPDGSLVVHRFTSDLPTGFSGRVLSLLLRWRLRRMQTKALEGLAAQSEVAPSG